jgi:hypothetical protein
MKTKILGILALTTLVACGGGGGGGSSGSAAAAASPPAPQSASVPSAPAASPAPAAAPSAAAADLSLAARLYKGDERTPSGFDVEQRPASVTGTLSTRHLRNTDFAGGPQAAGPVYEVCTNDMAQALAWSESLATWHGQYSDMVEVRSDDHLFEVIRVPRADVTAMLRHRVFKCDYLDRSGSDLRTDGGAAGAMNQRPLTAGELESLAEYLWQFTIFNNSDHAVESSTRSTDGTLLTHTIRMGQLVRGVNGSCDTVQLVDWTHTMNPVDGTLTRTLSNVRSYKTKSTLAGAESCGA